VKKRAVGSITYLSLPLVKIRAVGRIAYQSHTSNSPYFTSGRDRYAMLPTALIFTNGIDILSTALIFTSWIDMLYFQ
jgi:hypothetical protein